MKALLYTKPFHLEYTDVPDPEVPAENVLVRVEACGVCGSDVHGYTGSTGRRIPPLIMGHEASGVVEECGLEVSNFQIGDRVCFDSTVYCNRCQSCLRGQYNRCRRRQVLGVATPESKRDGAFAQFVSIPWWIVSKLPDQIGFTQAALLEPVSIAVHATNRTPLSTNSRVLIIGAGTIGLFLAQAVRLKGVRQLIVSDINEHRLQTLQSLQIQDAVNPQTINLKELVLERTEQYGVDIAFDAVGLAETFQQALELTGSGGHVTLIGNIEKSVKLNLQDLISRELTLSGTYANAGEYQSCIDLVSSGQIQVDPLISEVLPLKEGQSAFERLHAAQENLIKIILKP